jgi:hypothetical protein
MFRGDFSVDEVFSDPMGAIRWSEAAWREINFVKNNQSNYDIYHCRDKVFENSVEDYMPKAVFPLPRVMVDQIASKSTLPFLDRGSFTGVGRDASLFPGMNLDQEEIENVAMAAGCLIEQDLADWANGALNLPLWGKNASLAGAAMLTTTWRTETRKLPVKGGIEKRRQIMMPDGRKKSILVPELRDVVVRESLDIQALPPGTWSVDPECQDGQDMVWGSFEEYVPASTVINYVKNGYFNLCTLREAEWLIGGRAQDFAQERIVYFKHVFDDDSYKQFFGQAPNSPIDRVCLKVFYTKEVRIYSVGDMLLRIETNPYALLADGFPFEILTFNGTGNIIGTSDLYFLKPYFFEYNKLRNSELYNAELSSEQGWLTTEIDPQTIEDFKHREPGSIIYSPLGEKAFVPIPFNPISPEVRATRMGIMEDLMLISGLSETALGKTPPANVRSQQQMTTLLQQSASRMMAGNKLVENSMHSVARKFLMMYRNFMSETKVVKLFGEKANLFAQISPDHFGAVHDIELKNSLESAELRAARGGELLNFLPVAAQIPEFDVIALARDVLRDMGYNPDKYYKPGSPAAIPANSGGVSNAARPSSSGNEQIPILSAPQPLKASFQPPYSVN